MQPADLASRPLGGEDLIDSFDAGFTAEQSGAHPAHPAHPALPDLALADAAAAQLAAERLAADSALFADPDRHIPSADAARGRAAAGSAGDGGSIPALDAWLGAGFGLAFGSPAPLHARTGCDASDALCCSHRPVDDPICNGRVLYASRSRHL